MKTYRFNADTDISKVPTITYQKTSFPSKLEKNFFIIVYLIVTQTLKTYIILKPIHFLLHLELTIYLTFRKKSQNT